MTPDNLDMTLMMEDYIKRHPEFDAGKLRGLLPTIGELDKKNLTLGEFDPNGVDAHSPGSKLDAGKSPVFGGLIDYFPRACLAVANVSQVGAEKYTWKGWETVLNGYSRYSNALVRHLVSESIDGTFDKATGLTHAAHAAWNSMARLELLLREKE